MGPRCISPHPPPQLWKCWQQACTPSRKRLEDSSLGRETVGDKPSKKWWIPDQSRYRKACPTHTHTHTPHPYLSISFLVRCTYLQTKIIRHSRKHPTLKENNNNRLKEEPWGIRVNRRYTLQKEKSYCFHYIGGPITRAFRVYEVVSWPDWPQDRRTEATPVKTHCNHWSYTKLSIKPQWHWVLCHWNEKLLLN